MKSVILFILGSASVLQGYFENSDSEAIPQVDGTFRLTNISDVHAGSEFSTPQVSFYLFTRRNSNQGQMISIGDTSSLFRSSFNFRNPTRIIIHGWKNDVGSQVNKLLREAYLRRGDYNVIVVDWGSIAHTNNYVTARNSVENVGRVLAQFIDFLNASGRMSFNTLYLIGHSLGAHVSGFAGKFVKKGRIDTIIGLDPAWPLFYTNKPEQRLDILDANYVETIHTNGEKLGFFSPIGHSSFYPNYGKIQPGCGADITGMCSHSRSYEYLAESIITNGRFTATGCNNIDDVKAQRCKTNVSGIRMGGEPLPGRPYGIFYLVTNSQSPYAVS